MDSWNISIKFVCRVGIPRTNAGAFRADNVDDDMTRILWLVSRGVGTRWFHGKPVMSPLAIDEVRRLTHRRVFLF
ncbi:polysaccharide biosynthesis protein [Microbacterium sp. HM58-2]|nr:polysaccharide biosynthesis protein [Microbacterium sp. HM58-2]